MFFTRAPRLTRPRLIILAGVLAVAGLLLASIQASYRPRRHDADRPARPRNPAPAGPSPRSCWCTARGPIPAAGTRSPASCKQTATPFYAPPNPLQGLPYDTGTISSFLHSVSGPIVLVGHSYGGAVITNAAAGNSQVKALVYDDAYLPAKGDSLLTLTTGGCFAVSDPSTVFNFWTFPGAPPGVSDAYVKPSVFPGCFANGLPASEGAVLAATQRPLATSTFTDQSGTPAWATIPSWAIVGTSDHAITPADQLFMAHRADAHITQINAPHLSMISNPGVVAGVIIQAARATG